jgi:hypothetical protein
LAAIRIGTDEFDKLPSDGYFYDNRDERNALLNQTLTLKKVLTTD